MYMICLIACTMHFFLYKICPVTFYLRPNWMLTCHFGRSSQMSYDQLWARLALHNVRILQSHVHEQMLNPANSWQLWKKRKKRSLPKVESTYWGLRILAQAKYLGSLFTLSLFCTVLWIHTKQTTQHPIRTWREASCVCLVLVNFIFPRLDVNHKKTEKTCIVSETGLYRDVNNDPYKSTGWKMWATEHNSFHLDNWVLKLYKNVTK